LKAPNGLARRNSKLRRLSFGRDSFNTMRPNSALASARPAATKNGRREPYSPSVPPIAGPTMKPSPKAAPVNPKLAARFSGGDTSAI